METTPRPRSFLTVATLLAAGALAFLPAALPAQVDIPDIPEEEIEGEPEAKAPDVPPIPEWTPTDPTTIEQYRTARTHLDERRYSDAKNAFRRLRSAAKGTPGEATVDRCLLEAEGGLHCEKAGKYLEDEKFRKVIALWLKEGEELEGTLTGAELETIHEKAMDEVFEILANFEPKEGGAEAESDAEPEPAAPRGGRPGGAGGSEYGQNTRKVTGTPEEGEVRVGKGALHWITTSNIDVVSVAIPEGVYLDEYRYLRLSLRSDSRKISPPLILILDCEQGAIGGGGWGGGMGGARGAARAIGAVHRRVGYHGSLEAGYGWRDLRLDLRKLEARGEPRWSNVRNVRIVHLNSPEAGIYLDEVVLEKE